jgi:hypothetical protein
MKNTLLIGTVMLGLGVAIGWIARPSSDNEQPANTALPAAKAEETVAKVSPSDPPPAATPPGKRVLREPAVKKPTNMPSEEDMERAKKMQGEMTKSMVERQRAKFGQHLKRLEESVGLTADQKTKMTTWLDEKMKKFGDVDFTNVESMSGLTDLMGGGLSTKTLEDELAKSLTAEQQTALTAFREKDLQTKVDSAALKNLSQLQGIIEFEEGQRDEVYKILSAAAQEKLLKEEEEPDPTALFTEGMGIEMDPYDLGLQSAMTEAMEDMVKPGADTDQKQIARSMREIIDQRINQKVEKLRPVLNDKQLEQYRAELKAKGAGIYGTALMGMEGKETEVDFVVPAK